MEKTLRIVKKRHFTLWMKFKLILLSFEVLFWTFIIKREKIALKIDKKINEILEI